MFFGCLGGEVATTMSTAELAACGVSCHGMIDEDGGADAEGDLDASRAPELPDATESDDGFGVSVPEHDPWLPPPPCMPIPCPIGRLAPEAQ